jgi:hypothetical protein
MDDRPTWRPPINVCQRTESLDFRISGSIYLPVLDIESVILDMAVEGHSMFFLLKRQRSKLIASVDEYIDQ